MDQEAKVCLLGVISSIYLLAWPGDFHCDDSISWFNSFEPWANEAFLMKPFASLMSQITRNFTYINYVWRNKSNFGQRGMNLTKLWEADSKEFEPRRWSLEVSTSGFMASRPAINLIEKIHWLIARLGVYDLKSNTWSCQNLGDSLFWTRKNFSQMFCGKFRWIRAGSPRSTSPVP